MDLHRLRVVEFDTFSSEKEGDKKYMVEYQNCKQEDWKTSTEKDGTGDDNQYNDDDMSPPRLSKKCLDNKISTSATGKKYLNETACPLGTSKQCPDGKICSTGKSEKFLDGTTSTILPGPSKKDNCASCKIKSEIFKIPPKNKPRTRNLKINSSDIGVIKLFRDSADIHQKKRTFNLRNRNSRLQRKVENVKEKNEKNKQVHVLFARETPSFIKYCQKRPKSKRTTAKKKRDSELLNNIYGFQKRTRSMDQHQYRMSCLHFIDTDEIHFRELSRGLHLKHTPPSVKPRTSSACKHHRMRVLNSACTIGQSPPIYYSLGSRKRRSQKEQGNDQKEGMRRELSNSIVKDEIVEVSSSSLKSVSISCRDAGISANKVGLSAVCRRRHPSYARDSPVLQNVTITSERNQEPCPLPYKRNQEPCPQPYKRNQEPCPQPHKRNQEPCPQPYTRNQEPCPQPYTRNQKPCPLSYTPKPGAQNKGKPKCNEMKKTKSNVPVGFISRVARQFTGFQTKKLLTGESCIKYVFFGLLIVVWSPCLLAVFIAWVVMFPVKFTSILKMNRFCKKDPRCEYQRIRVKSERASFMESATSWYSRTVGSVANTLTSLLRLKKKSPTGAASSFLPSSHPNPKKKYSLFYADNRGWVIKPLRGRNKRPSVSTRVVPKAYSAQKVNSNPWHKSRAAEVQRTRSWDKSNCYNEYPQGTPMFLQPSRYHQRPQQHLPGLGRTDRAEGGLLHPHSDFNHVPMRYPDPNSTYKQSKNGRHQLIVNHQSQAPNHGCGPCYTNPANPCTQNTVPSTESALRRAYKRRPLRYTPPREHLPRIVMEKRIKENKIKAVKAKQRKATLYRANLQSDKGKSFFMCVRDFIIQTDREAWPNEIKCHQMWLNALKKKPCFWIYRYFPSVYPSFLNFYKFLLFLRPMFVYLLTICFWIPLVMCCYFCCNCMSSRC